MILNYIYLTFINKIYLLLTKKERIFVVLKLIKQFKDKQNGNSATKRNS